MTETAWLILLSALVLVASIVGVFYSWQMLREARGDLDVATELAPDRADLRIIGEGHVRSERNRLLTQAALASVAAISTTTTILDFMPAWVRFVSRFLVTAAVMLVFANSYLNARTRRTAVRMIRDSEADVTGVSDAVAEAVLPGSGSEPSDA